MKLTNILNVEALKSLISRRSNRVPCQGKLSNIQTFTAFASKHFHLTYELINFKNVLPFGISSSPDATVALLTVVIKINDHWLIYLFENRSEINTKLLFHSIPFHEWLWVKEKKKKIIRIPFAFPRTPHRFDLWISQQSFSEIHAQIILEYISIMLFIILLWFEWRPDLDMTAIKLINGFANSLINR